MLPWAIRALFYLPILISLGLALAIGPVLPDLLAGRRPPSTMLVAGLLSAIVPFGFLLIHAVAFVKNLYHVRRRTALAFVLRMAFPIWLIPIGWLRRLILPKAQARDGDLTPESRTSPVARIGGPGFLIVHESNAVILERWGSFARLVGPGEHLLEPFEHPAMVLDLRPQSRHRTVNPWTRDGIRVQCGLRIWCVLDWQGPDAENRERLIRMAYQLYRRTEEESMQVDWASDLADEAAIVLAHQIAAYPFDALWSPYVEAGSSPSAPPRVLGDSPERQGASELPDWGIPERPPADAPTMVLWEDLRRQVQEETERIAREMGARLLYLSLEPPVPHPDIRAEVEQAWLAQWQAPWRAWVVHQHARAVSERMRFQELARALGQRELLEAMAKAVRQENQAGAPQQRLHRIALRIIEVIEQWARPHGEEATLTELVELLRYFEERLRSGSDQTAGGRGTP
ncbi:MAG: hypothetical protein C4313_00210 [Thermoflexus sp.]|uniref:hypothetical protein n=1 Tax=Thermoflexus sp. TaxID=1969742 RepID=UPI003329FE70